jgi:hypothetical protein
MAKNKNNNSRKNMSECMTPHMMMHSLFGMGLGITLCNLFPSLGILWVGLALMVAAWGLDYMRK